MLTAVHGLESVLTGRLMAQRLLAQGLGPWARQNQSGLAAGCGLAVTEAA
jgi:hypothetical protein